jgi:hypothetical protein
LPQPDELTSRDSNGYHITLLVSAVIHGYSMIPKALQRPAFVENIKDGMRAVEMMQAIK